MTCKLEFIKASIIPKQNSPVIVGFGNYTPSRTCIGTGIPEENIWKWSGSDGSPFITYTGSGLRLGVQLSVSSKSLPYLCTVGSTLGTFSVDVLDFRVAGMQL